MARKKLPKSSAQVKRIAELEDICAELYQVIGILADRAGCFSHPDIQRALDNASKTKFVHRGAYHGRKLLYAGIRAHQ
jgi:hypothetical protein